MASDAYVRDETTVDQPDRQSPQIDDVIILGSGPAGWAAAIYAARGNRKPLVLTGSAPGGQIVTTAEVENYPGFPEGITGPEIGERMQVQAEKFGAIVERYVAEEIDVDGPPFAVRASGGKCWLGRALIIATGATPKKLGVPGEDRFVGSGVSYCATCDGFFYQDREVLVVGGGDSALQEALFLTRYASRVRIVHRRDELRASSALQRMAKANPKLDYIWESVVRSIDGSGMVEGVALENVRTGAVSTVPADGVFIFIGHSPNNQVLKGKIALDEHGYAVTDKLMQTSIPGIFAAGEIQDPHFRQVATSVGQGVSAALTAEKYLSTLGSSSRRIPP